MEAAQLNAETSKRNQDEPKGTQKATHGPLLMFPIFKVKQQNKF